MALSTAEARKTLEALDRLIIATEWRGLKTRAQRDALEKLRRRRSALISLLAVRREQALGKVIDLQLWRDGPPPIHHPTPADPIASRAP
jgi:hypothetical protein